MFKFFIFSIIFLIVIGCEQQETNKSKIETQAETTHSDCENIKSCLRIPLGGKIKTIDPSIVTIVLDYIVVDQLFIGLTALEKDTYNVVPALATDWQINEEGKTYIFTLRQNLAWSDGKPITAHDFVWTIQHNLAKKSPNASALFVIKNAEQLYRGEVDKSMLGVQAINNYKLKFELKHAAGYFPSLVNLRVYRPLPQHIVTKYGTNWTEPKNIVTSGPYYLNNWDKGNKINLKRNKLYYAADKTQIQELYYYIIPENHIGLTMYEKNDLDIMGGLYLKLPQSEIPRIEENAQLSKEIKMGPQGCTEWYGFNTKRFPTDNINVRKAISSSIDKQLLLEVVFGDSNIPANTITPSWLLTTKTEQQLGLQFDPNQANEFLTKANYSEGKGFPEIVLMRSTGETDDREVSRGIKTFLKYYLKINIKVVDLAANRYMATILGKPFDEKPHIFRIRWCADYPDANDFLYQLFHPDKGYFGWLINDEDLRQELTEVMEKTQWVTDPIERRMLYKQVEIILVEKAAVVMPLYFDNVQFLIKKRVKGWYNMAFGGQHVFNWSLEN